MIRRPWNHGNNTGRQRRWYQLRFDPPNRMEFDVAIREMLLWMRKHDHPSLYSAWDGHTLWKPPRNYLLIRVEDQGVAGLMRVLFETISA